MLLCNANITFFLIRNNTDYFKSGATKDECHNAGCLVGLYAKWAVFEFFWLLGIFCHFRVMVADPGFTDKDYINYEETELNGSDKVLIEFLEP